MSDGSAQSISRDPTRRFRAMRTSAPRTADSTAARESSSGIRRSNPVSAWVAIWRTKSGGRSAKATVRDAESVVIASQHHEDQVAGVGGE